GPVDHLHELEAGPGSLGGRLLRHADAPSHGRGLRPDELLPAQRTVRAGHRAEHGVRGRLLRRGGDGDPLPLPVADAGLRHPRPRPGPDGGGQGRRQRLRLGHGLQRPLRPDLGVRGRNHPPGLGAPLALRVDLGPQLGPPQRAPRPHDELAARPLLRGPGHPRHLRLRRRLRRGDAAPDPRLLRAGRRGPRAQGGDGQDRPQRLVPRGEDPGGHRQAGPDVVAAGPGADRLPLAGLAQRRRLQRPDALGEPGRPDGPGGDAGLPRPRDPDGPGPVARSMADLQTLLFDLDGTLVRTREASWELFRQTNEKFGLGVDTPSAFFRLFNQNFYAALGQKSDSEEVKRHFQELLRDEYSPDLVPGMANVVHALAGHYTLIVLSSNTMEAVRRILLNCDVAHCFAHVFTGDVTPSKVDAIRRFLADPSYSCGRRCSPHYEESTPQRLHDPQEAM